MKEILKQAGLLESVNYDTFAEFCDHFSYVVKDVDDAERAYGAYIDCNQGEYDTLEDYREDIKNTPHYGNMLKRFGSHQGVLDSGEIDDVVLLNGSIFIYNMFDY